LLATLARAAARSWAMTAATAASIRLSESSASLVHGFINLLAKQASLLLSRPMMSRPGSLKIMRRRSFGP